MLRALGGFLEPLQSHAVVAESDSSVFFEAVDEPIHDSFVEVFAAEVRVAGGGEDFEQTVFQLEYRNIERAAAEIVDGDQLVLAIVETVRERGRSGLVDDAQDFESGDSSGVARGLALRVVEVGRHGDDRLTHGLAEKFFSE